MLGGVKTGQGDGPGVGRDGEHGSRGGNEEKGVGQADSKKQRTEGSNMCRFRHFLYILIQATEERELLMELAMSRMSDKVVLLEQENRESRCLVKEMEEQVSRLVEENRILREETSEGKEEEHFSMKDELADK